MKGKHCYSKTSREHRNPLNEVTSFEHLPCNMSLNQVQFRDDYHSERLVEGRRNAETKFVRTPVERADWLSAQGHVLEKVNRPCYSHVHAVAVLRHALGRVRTINKQSHLYMYSDGKHVRNLF